MLSPKRTKYRKTQKGHNRGTAYRGSDVSFGDFAQMLCHRDIKVAGLFIRRRRIGHRTNLPQMRLMTSTIPTNPWPHVQAATRG